MIEALLVVLTNAAEGRDADFNDWYSNVHARDAMRMRGAIAQQRFHFSADQVMDWPDGFVAQYLALYECSDAAWFTQEHIDRARTPFMIVEDSLDMSRLDDFYFFPLQFRDKQPRTFQNCSVVLEQLQPKEGKEAAFREWYNDTYLPERFRHDGITTAALLTFEQKGQMMPFPPTHDHIAIWRLNDDSARDIWRDSTALQDCPHIDQRNLAVTCWDICSDRITEDDVSHPAAEALAKEEAARARIKAQDSVITEAKGRIKSS